jgi:GNAT superfamily N-acetyltransferase
MKLKKTIKKNVYGVKISFEEKGKEIGRALLYVINNELHQRPFGLLEDVFVHQEYRSQGLGSKLVKQVIAEAKKRKCYKLIATSRNSKPELQKFYKKFGLNVWGVEYRKNF